MGSYFLKNYTSVEFVKSIQQLANKDKISLEASGKDVLGFNKGSIWAVTSHKFYVQGEFRFQQIGDDVFCSIIFTRTKIWMTNAILGILLFLLTFGMYLVSTFQALDLNLYSAIWLGSLSYAGIASTLFIVFGDLYLVTKAEKIFRKNFELWYTNLI